MRSTSARSVFLANRANFKNALAPLLPLAPAATVSFPLKVASQQVNDGLRTCSCVPFLLMIECIRGAQSVCCVALGWLLMRLLCFVLCSSYILQPSAVPAVRQRKRRKSTLGNEKLPQNPKVGQDSFFVVATSVRNKSNAPAREPETLPICSRHIRQGQRAAAAAADRPLSVAPCSGSASLLLHLALQ